MTLRVVFLDRASIEANVRRPRAATDYIEYPGSQGEEVLKRLKGATVAITNKVPLREALLRELPDLKLIAVAATGYDVVDVGYCREHGVAVANIRNYAVHTVPEHAFALILALRRNLIAYRDDVARGAWNRCEQFCFFDHPIRDLHGAQLGIIGEGVLGRAVAAIGAAFGMHAVFRDHPDRVGEDLEYQALPRLLAESDVLSLHCPLLPSTRNLIGAGELRAMKPTALLINTARGGLVDERALVRALQEGWIAGAGIDVLTTEPPREGNPLLELHLPNLIVTPHVAWASLGAMQFLADQLIDNIDAWSRGTPQNLVT
ncbi:MAG TPA: D-2-hydroxyacid dehydrogenase [Steroidobacteraceae bacterium]